MGILLIIPVSLLLILSIEALYTSIQLYLVYQTFREVALFHLGIIIFTVFLSFITGGIGVLLQLDQMTHPLFMLNAVFLSMNYFGVGLIYRSLNSNSHQILLDYSLLVLAFAPIYTFIVFTGALFNPIVALASQLLPLLLTLSMDYSLVKQMSSSRSTLEGESEIEILDILINMFKAAGVIHFLGILAMISFAIYFIIGNTEPIEQIWVGEWQSFDYFFLMLLFGILILFSVFAKQIRCLSNAMNTAKLDVIMNSIMR